ncbi:hypothetical protein HMF8227_00277 [Saliniradius amylolyticus]|uniref:MSHA biogenesis protein MshN n=1 Tax=Saliniradius amylolyticus TaxID=2183582 RepID=A0A2S2DZE6_9ALTE|nr:tetratricopeptide repeat protein [Saliniradius amylolyticus]AWL10785.1 hypothetical protein HMF8227_00277 [Saliniradius amylolyticus]
MSVVNKMLKDLEQRQQHTSSAESDYQPRKTSFKRRFGPVMLVVLLVVIAGWVLFDTFRPVASVEVSDKGQPAGPMPIQKYVESAPAEQKINETAQPTAGPDVSSPNQTLQVQTTVAKQQPNTPATKPAAIEQDSKEPETDSKEVAVSLPQNAGEQPAQQDTAQPATEQAAAEPPQPDVRKRQVEVSEAEQVRRQLEPLLAERKYKLAFPLLARLLELEPGAHNIRAKLINLSLRQGRRPLAEGTLQQAVEQFPEHYEYRSQLARLWRQDKPQQALALLMAAKPPVASYTDYYALRAGLARGQGQFFQAVKDYYQLLELQPDNDRWRLGMAIALDKAGQHQPALKQYHQVSNSTVLPEQARRFIQQRIDALGGR